MAVRVSEDFQDVRGVVGLVHIQDDKCGAVSVQASLFALRIQIRVENLLNVAHNCGVVRPVAFRVPYIPAWWKGHA